MPARRFGIMIVAAALALTGCTATYQERGTGGVETSSVKLDPARSVMVALPADGQYGNKPYRGTGQLVAQKTSAAFSRHARRVELGPPTTGGLDSMLATARQVGAGYLIVPTINHWEQRATEWSGIPSRVNLILAVIDVQTGRELRSSLLESRSASVTLIRAHADDLAERLIDDSVNGLYRR